MASVGFKQIIFAEYDKDGAVKETFEVNSEKGGAIEAKLSGIGATLNTTWASDGQFYVSAQGTSSPKLSLGIADLYPELYQSMTGAEVNEQGFTVIGNKTRPPYMGVVLVTADKDGNDLFIGLAKGKFTAPDEELKTSEDKGAELQTDSVEGDFVSRGSDGLVVSKATTATEGVTLEAFKDFIFGAATAGK